MKEWSLLSAQPISSRDVTEPVKRNAAVDILRAQRRCAAANTTLKINQNYLFPARPAEFIIQIHRATQAQEHSELVRCYQNNKAIQ
jgi:hypothetical protein